ncbi:MAG TPA: hypothetical protein VHN16_14400 [Streptosporangiaceae bacterium]|nr:hypothetical protein [Streptosporangiaceae bacterium]
MSPPALPVLANQTLTWVLLPQHGNFVAQHQQLGVLRRCRACQQGI